MMLVVVTLMSKPIHFIWIFVFDSLAVGLSDIETLNRE